MSANSETKSKNEERFYYFTWGTLKRGFANHDNYKEVLDDFVGEYSTKNQFTMIVPNEVFCPNPGCQWVHHIGALMDAVPGHGDHIQGEVFNVTRAGIKKLDKLENYSRCWFKKSTYIRKRVELVAKDTSEIITAFIYIINDGRPFLNLLSCEKAVSTPTYTKKMDDDGRVKKQCCVKNPGHCGPHDKLKIPTCSC
jgi:gamma-glutamylcyclotransferase (GGCT)/AIG2-like uncharacterized protein YtfP